MAFCWQQTGYLPTPKKQALTLHPALSRIGFFGKPEARNLMVALGNSLISNSNSSFIIFAQRPQDAKFYATRLSTCEAVVVIDHLHRAHTTTPSPTERAAVIARAKHWEERLGITINELTVSHRHFGRGYALGGFRHPRSRMSEAVPYDAMLAGYVAQLDALDEAIRKHRLTMILGGPREAALLARFHGIPFRTLSASRYRNFHYWGCDEFWQSDAIAAKFHDPALPLNYKMDAPIYGYMVNRGRFFERVSFPGVAKQIALRIARQVYWTIRGYDKRKNYFFLQDIAYHVRLPFAWRELRRMSHTRLSDLQDSPYVYMPLQTEPEMALQGLSPRNSAQLATLAAVARDLPAGVMLAVKETLWAVGRRPKDFYGQIAEFKNVVLIDPMEPGQSCVAQAKAVALITGSSGFEAAAMGVPVLSFGAHNIYNFVPHVRQVSLQDNLHPILLDSVRSDATAEARRRDGERFLNAVVAASFDLGQFDFVHQDSFDQNAIAAAVDGLVGSLAAPARNLEKAG